MKKDSLLLRLSVAVPILSAFASVAVAADIEPWAGIPNVSATTNWSDTANWSGASHNPNNNHVIFGNAALAGLGVINSVVDTSTNCFSLNFTNTAAGYNNLLVQPGQTLTIDGTSTVTNGTATIVNGTASLVAIPGGQVAATNTISGQYGAVLITGVSAGGVYVQTTNSSAGSISTFLDLSGLGTFIVSNTAAYGALWVGNGVNRCDGVLNLAMTNYLALATNGTGNAAAFVVGDNTSNNGSSPGGTLNLGQANTILADNISVGLSKQTSALVRFNPAFTNAGANPFVTIRGFSGAAVKKWSIGDGLAQSGTSAGGSGTVDFRNGTVNAVATVLVIGRPSSTSVTAPTSTGILSLSAGSISATVLTNAAMTTVAGVGGTPTNQTASGTINITGSATFNANTVVTAILLGTGGTSTSTFNVTNGTLAVGTLSAGGGTSAINVNSGTLIVTNTAGTTAAPLTALNLTAGTVQLSVNGTANVTNIVATAVNTNGTAPTTIIIGSVANVSSTITIPLISYTGTDPFGNLTLGALPNSFTGILVDNSANNRIDLQVSPPVAAAALVWVGATNAVLDGNWDYATSNWLDAATMSIPMAFANLDSVLFNDTASNGIVTLTTNLTPLGLLITNNALNYTFNGTGLISGATSLIKNGPGSLTLAETGGDSFNSGIIVSNGTLILDNASSGITGGLNIAGGTVQVGNNDANGNLPGGVITDNGALVFTRTDNLALSTAIPGTGSVTQNGSDTLTLSGANSYAGGLFVNAGTVRLSTLTAQGGGSTITVANTGTLVLSAAITNSITLSGGILGESASLSPLTNDLYVTAGTTSLVYEADPQNLTPGDANEMAWSNTLHGSGSFIVATVTNDASADSGNGFRLRGITPTAFSGTITFSNNVKGELQTTVTTPFSPAGTATLQLLCGSYLGNNSTTNNLTSPGYTELNLRNNGPGNCTFGNDVTVLGTGFTTLDPLGSAPVGASVTMGNLTIGNGQVLGVYLSAAPAHVIVFPTVTLTGGTATLSPKTPGFGATSSVGSDLSLGSISELSPSSLVLTGLRTNFFTGNSTYSGATTVSNGVLEVDGSILGTGNVTVESGALLTGVGLIAGPVTVAAGGTLSPGNVSVPTSSLSISNSLTLGGTNIMDVNKAGSTFVNDVITNITTVTYGGTLQLNLTGTALAAGDAFQLYSCSFATGAFAAIIPATPGAGLLWNTNTLATGVLSVINAVNPNPTNIVTSVSGGVLTLSWPADHTGWTLQAQTNTLATGLSANWADVAGSDTTNLINVPIDPDNGAVFYRMILNP